MMNFASIANLNKNFVYKVLLGFIFLFLFRLGVHIPAPGVDVGYFLSKINQGSGNSLFGAMTTISSGVFGSFSLLSLGVMPYILASILTQIVSYVYQEEKGLKNQKEQDFFAKISRIFTLVFALIQSIVLFWSIKNKCTFFYCDANITLIYILSFLSILAGSMVSMWIGEVISEYSIGSGISMIIFTNIGFDFISGVMKVIASSDTNNNITLSLAALMVFIVVCVIVLCEKSVRLVEVQYSSASKFGDSKVTKSSFIPLKMNFSVVMPMIFTMTIIGFSMSMLNSLIGISSGIFDNVIFFVLRNQWFYHGIYFALIFGFSLLYNGITFNTEKVSDSLRKSCGVVLGVKPGLDTKNYFSHILARLTFLGSLYLFTVSLAVDFFKVALNMNSFIGGTSYLIITVIALELMSKYEVELLSARYNDYRF